MLKGGRWHCFAWACFACVLLVLGTVSLVLPLWNSVPNHVGIKLRMSALDWFQAKALASSGYRYEQRGQEHACLNSWRLAVGNHPGSIHYNRQFLASLQHYDQDRSFAQEALQTAFWTLQLSRTNRNDLDLAARVLGCYRLEALLLPAIEGGVSKEVLPVAVERAYLSGIFETRDIERFFNRWHSVPVGTQNDPTLQVYRDFIDASAAIEAVADRGRLGLLATTQDPKEAETAYRCLLVIAGTRGRLSEYQPVFQVLLDQYPWALGLADHLVYWKLLQAAGLVEKACDLARVSQLQPQRGDELIALVQSFNALGLGKLGLRYLEQYEDKFGENESVWFLRSKMLVEDENWLGLDRFVSRNLESSSGREKSWSYLFSGLARLELNRPVLAAQEFDRLKSCPIIASDFALKQGFWLYELGHGRASFEMLRHQTTAHRDHFDYWELLLKLAHDQRSSKFMLLASENLLRLEPGNLRIQLNHAALLLSERRMPERQLAVAFKCLQQYPEKTAVRLIYAQALIRNARLEEAEEVLISIDTSKLSFQMSQAFHFAWAELLYLNGDERVALDAIQKVQAELLLPGEQSVYLSIRGALTEGAGGARRHIEEVNYF